MRLPASVFDILCAKAEDKDASEPSFDAIWSHFDNFSPETVMNKFSLNNFESADLSGPNLQSDF